MKIIKFKRLPGSTKFNITIIQGATPYHVLDSFSVSELIASRIRKGERVPLYSERIDVALGYDNPIFESQLKITYEAL